MKLSVEDVARLRFSLKTIDELLNKIEPVKEQKKPVKPKKGFIQKRR